MHWFVKLLFWPWFRALHALHEVPIKELTTFSAPLVGALILLVALAGLILFLRSDRETPRFLEIAMRLILSLLVVGLLGALANGAVAYVNAQEKMPTIGGYPGND